MGVGDSELCFGRVDIGRLWLCLHISLRAVSKSSSEKSVDCHICFVFSIFFFYHHNLDSPHLLSEKLNSLLLIFILYKAALFIYISVLSCCQYIALEKLTNWLLTTPALSCSSLVFHQFGQIRASDTSFSFLSLQLCSWYCPSVA